MTENFKRFMQKKEEELEMMGSTQIDYETEIRMFGTRAMTTRQPPSLHAMMAVMAKYIPLTTKAEIINEAIAGAYVAFIDTVPEDRKKQIAAEFTEEFNHYVALIAPEVGESQGLVVDKETRQLALTREAEKGDES